MRALALCLALIILILPGCDDPSSVGLDLIDDDGALPTQTTVPATRAEEEVRIRELTGSAVRVLSGTVADPIAGTIATTGYLDFSEPVAVPSAFRNGPVTDVSLRLTIDYVYGDNQTPGVLLLRDMDTEWTNSNIPADSQLTAGQEAASVGFSPADTLVVVALPESWVDQYETILRSAGSDTSFHGFQLTTVGGNAIVGFRTDSAVLRIVSGGEVISFPVNRRLTTAQRLTSTAPPSGRLTIQDTAGPGVALEFAQLADSVSAAFLNRGQIRVTVDSLSLVENTPPNFVRPTVGSLELQAVTVSGATVSIATAPIVDGTANFGGNLVRSALQGIVDQKTAVDYFRVIVASNNDGAGTVLLHATGTADPPKAILTTSSYRP